MLRYLNNTGDRPVTVFRPALRYSLQRHLAIGKGDSLVRRAQDIAIQVSSSLLIEVGDADSSRLLLMYRRIFDIGPRISPYRSLLLYSLK